MGPTNPAAGVTATSPATAPEIAPSALARPFLNHSAALQLSAAAAAAKCVATNALVASELEASALPALNPNHPTHSRQAPMKLSTRLCGGIGCFGYRCVCQDTARRPARKRPKKCARPYHPQNPVSEIFLRGRRSRTRPYPTPCAPAAHTPPETTAPGTGPCR